MFKFQMMVTAKAIYPFEQYDVGSLSPQQHEDDLPIKLNKNFRQVLPSGLEVTKHMLNLLRRYSLRLLPSDDADSYLQRFASDLLKYSEVKQLHGALIPISVQIESLNDELLDAFKIAVKESLLKELGEMTLTLQKQLAQTLNEVSKVSYEERKSVGLDYITYKMTQSVTGLCNIIQRGLSLDLFRDVKAMENTMTTLELEMMIIFQKAMHSFIETPIPSTYHNVDIEQMLKHLYLLHKDQLYVTEKLWSCLVKGTKAPIVLMKSLLANTTLAIADIDTVMITEVTAPVNKSQLISILFKIATRHQIITEMLLDMEKMAPGSTDFDMKVRYVLKTQTMELIAHMSQFFTEHFFMDKIVSKRIFKLYFS